MLDIVEARDGTLVRVLPAKRAIVSWNARVPAAAIELIVHTVDGRRSRSLPYVAFEPGARASLDGFDDVARITTDVVESTSDIVAIDVRANAEFDRVAVSTAAYAPRTPGAPPFAGICEVPRRSQYLAAFPAERGWCAPAALAMLLAYHGCERSVDEVAAGVYDRAYHGTGNWALAIAYAAACGLAGAAAYVRDLGTVDALLAARLPVALSLAWDAGSLPGAPLERSAGHLVVVCGRDANGDAIVNDPAQPDVLHTYPRAAFERAWLDHGGVALLVAPPDRVDDLVRCANV